MCQPCDEHIEAYPILTEKEPRIPPDGIHFDIPPQEKGLYTKAPQTALRRLPINGGHPSNADLQRCIRVSRGSVVAQSLCRYLKCHTCAQFAKPKTPRPGKVQTDGLQFNEVEQMDMFHIHDAAGTQAWFMATVDLATD